MNFLLNLQYWNEWRLEKFYNRNCNKIFSEVLMILFSPELNLFCSILDLVTTLKKEMNGLRNGLGFE